jgi:hypothetical protein
MMACVASSSRTLTATFCFLAALVHESVRLREAQTRVVAWIRWRGPGRKKAGAHSGHVATAVDSQPHLCFSPAVPGIIAVQQDGSAARGSDGEYAD